MAKSIANQLSPSQVLGRAATLLRLLEDAGLPYEAWQIPIDNLLTRMRLVAYWKSLMPGMAELPAAQAAEKSVQSLAPIYDARAVNDLLSLDYSEDQLTAYTVLGPYPEPLPGFLTFFDPGWDNLRLRKFCAREGIIFSDQDWYNDEAFAQLGEEPRYRQLRMEAVDGSFNKNFDEQVLLLPANEEVPSARVVCMGMAIHFLLSGQRLFEKDSVRCADRSSVGNRVYVGGFDSDGFAVGHCWDDGRRGSLGLASSRKF